MDTWKCMLLKSIPEKLTLEVFNKMQLLHVPVFKDHISYVWRASMSGMKGAFTTLSLFHKPNRVTGNHWSIHSMIGMEQISTLLDHCLTSELLNIITLNMLFPDRVTVWRSIPFTQPGTLFLLYPTSELLQNHSISPDCSQT